MNLRGDIAGLLLYFVVLFLGACQLVVAWKRLNGWSLTGYPDRRALSVALGVVLVVGSTAWYYSRPGHFVAPDVEGLEVLVFLAVGMTCAVAVQTLLASLLFRRKYRVEAVEDTSAERLFIDDCGGRIPSLYFESAPGGGGAVLVLGDYGRPVSETARLCSRIAASGHPCLAVELDGGPGGRPLIDPTMQSLLTAALEELSSRAGAGPVDVVVGVGFGGAVAMGLAGRGSVGRVLALDPPARDAHGHPATNSARELKPPELLKALFAPGARGKRGRAAMSRAVDMLPVQPGPGGKDVTVFGTLEPWLNSPAALAAYTSRLDCGAPLLVPVRHAGMTRDESIMAAVLDSLEKNT